MAEPQWEGEREMVAAGRAREGERKREGSVQRQGNSSAYKLVANLGTVTLSLLPRTGHCTGPIGS